MKLGFASDHRGFNLKNELIKYFEKKGYEIVDCGTYSLMSVDYPDYAYQLSMKIVSKEVMFGIAICGSGIGISIACNKVKGVYCAKVNDSMEARYTRHDNDANCVAFSEKISLDMAIDIVDTFINTPFSKEERHSKRIKKLKAIESGTYNA